MKKIKKYFLLILKKEGIRFKEKNFHKYRLKGYTYIKNQILREDLNNSIFLKLFKYSESVLEEFYKSFNILLDEIKKKHQISKEQDIKQTYFGKGYIKKGEPGFETVKSNRENLLYKAVIYKITVKFGSFNDMVYIGWARDENIRLTNHIINAIGPHNSKSSYKTIVPIHKVIRLGIQENFNLLKKRINLIDQFLYIIPNIQDIDDLFIWLNKSEGNKWYFVLLDFKR